MKKNNFLIQIIKKFVKIFLPEDLKQRFLLFYAVKALNGPYTDKSNIRVIVHK